MRATGQCFWQFHPDIVGRVLGMPIDCSAHKLLQKSLFSGGLTPLESRKRMAAWLGSKTLSPGRSELGRPAPSDARRLSAAESPDPRLIMAPAKEK